MDEWKVGKLDDRMVGLWELWMVDLKDKKMADVMVDVLAVVKVSYKVDKREYPTVA